MRFAVEFELNSAVLRHGREKEMDMLIEHGSQTFVLNRDNASTLMWYETRYVLS